ncbi:CubicO group peptidase (beta-lactamase class C family) [Rhodoferax ferrireducens]|uniref:CubicO group peptidase (Beta-lactamase class C family) n=1 Tax=Rhodoferax ferrireducens TaxID=192843 RepID=A0ABU2C3F5_9BURK|nr:serine hydrolase [Rhodoferax ferrireducens]MDR7375867.1 CubicO group peptidase (beta-lactamase class C family) [Rhodoferax ferrireducens]
MQNKTTSRREFVAGSLAAALGGAIPFNGSSAAEKPGDWAESKDSGVDQAGVQKVLDDARSLKALRSVVVIKNGSLVAEQYYGGVAATDLQAVNSVTKSIASILVGAAIEQGKIKSLSETVGSLLPAAAERAPHSAVLAITLEQILSDTSGLVYDFQTGVRALEAAEDPVSFVLGLPVDPQQVGKWVYNDAAISLLSPILVQAQGMSVDQLAQRDLFSPLGIEKIAAAKDRAGNFLSYRGLRLRARDLAKVAWTMTNGGRWGDKQIVPLEWVKESTRPHVLTTWGATPMRRTGYGYLWFTGDLGERPVVWAWGYGAQFALVVPSLRLAVVTTATNPSPADLVAQNNAVMTMVAQIVAVAE